MIYYKWKSFKIYIYIYIPDKKSKHLFRYEAFAYNPLTG